MHPILQDIAKQMKEEIRQHLKDVTDDMLEEGGAVYYMNGKNGTEFDWHVNSRLSDLFIFYNDKENLGAAKAQVYRDGTMLVWTYGDHGHRLGSEQEIDLHVPEEEMKKLAAVLRNEADDRRIWDTDLAKIDTDREADEAMLREFTDNRKYYGEMIERRNMFARRAYVSKKLLDEKWKVGYMTRDEPLNEQDSGWSFLAGNESDEYVNDASHIVLWPVGAVCQFDPAVMKHITDPIGTSLIRISSDAFEEDRNDKEIFMEKQG